MSFDEETYRKCINFFWDIMPLEVYDKQGTPEYLEIVWKNCVVPCFYHIRALRIAGLPVNSDQIESLRHSFTSDVTQFNPLSLCYIRKSVEIMKLKTIILLYLMRVSAADLVELILRSGCTQRKILPVGIQSCVMKLQYVIGNTVEPTLESRAIYSKFSVLDRIVGGDHVKLVEEMSRERYLGSSVNLS